MISRQYNKLLYTLSPVLLAMIVASLDMAVMPTILPSIAIKLGGITNSTWVMSAYMFAATVTAPVYGRLSDFMDIRKLLRIALFIFTGGAILCACAINIKLLILFRFIEGCGCGGLMVLGFIIVGKTVSEQELGICQGILGGVCALAALLGPPLGGFVCESFGWQFVFLGYVPLCATAFILSYHCLLELKTGTGIIHFDFIGALLLTGMIAVMLFMINRFASDASGLEYENIIAGVVFTILVTTFIYHENHTQLPLIPVMLLKRKALIVILGAVFFSSLGSSAAAFFLPQYFQYVLGVSSGVSGVLMEPVQISMIIGPIMMGFLVVRYISSKTGLLLNMMLLAISYFCLALPENALTVHYIAIPSLILLGFALGAIMPLLTIIVQKSVDKSMIGAATSLLGLSRSLGSLFGVVILKLTYSTSLVKMLGIVDLGKVSVNDALAKGILAFGKSADIKYVTIFDNAFSNVFYCAAGLVILSFLIAYQFDDKHN